MVFVLIKVHSFKEDIPTQTIYVNDLLAISYMLNYSPNPAPISLKDLS